jgi:hypothetical protein
MCGASKAVWAGSADKDVVCAGKDLVGGEKCRDVGRDEQTRDEA